MKNILCAIAALATSVLAACAGSDDPAVSDDPVGSVASAVVNGTDDTSAHDSVVLLLLEPQGKILGSCTGTLVAPNLLLTARHCVSDTDESVICKADGTAYQGGSIKGDYAPSALLVYPGVNAISSAASPAKAAARGKSIITETSSVLCNHDLAFIVLDTDVNAPTAPMRTASGAVTNESLTVDGWGLTQSGKLPGARQTRTGVKVIASGPYVIDKDTNIGLGESEFAVGESICSGDSGGPAFSSQGALVGVVSRGGGGPSSDTNQASTCLGTDVVNEYTELAKKSALVAKAFAAAGYQPRLEGTAPGVANGASCTADTDCNSQACVASTCVTRCDDSTAAGCGNGQACTDKSAVKVCLTPSQVTALNTAAVSAPTTSSSSGGCATAPGRSGGVGGLVIALSLLILRRRRSGRTAQGDR